MKKNSILLCISLILIAGTLTIFVFYRDNEKSPDLPIEPNTVLPEKPIVEPVEKPIDKAVEKPVDQPLPESGPKKLFNYKISDIISLEFISYDDKISITKTGSRWTVNDDFYGRIDQEKVQKKVTELLTMDSLESVGLWGSDSDEWGIKPAAQKITIKTADNILTILPGKLNKNGQGYYLQLEGSDEIYLVKNSIGESLKLKLDDLRDRDITIFDKDHIHSMKIKNGKLLNIIPYKKFDMFTADKYNFMLESPYSAYIPVNNEAFDTFLSNQKSLIHIADFIDRGDPEDYGITGESQGLTVKNKEGKDFELLIGASAGDSYVYGMISGEKQIFTLSRKDLLFLDVKPFDLAEKRPLLISIETIDSFMVSSDEFSVLGTQDNRRDYTINGIETEEKTFQSLFSEIQELTLSGEAEKEFSISKPEVIFSYKLNDGGTQWTHINFYNYDPENYSVALNEEKPLFIIDKSQMKEKLKKITGEVDRIMGF